MSAHRERYLVQRSTIWRSLFIFAVMFVVALTPAKAQSSCTAPAGWTSHAAVPAPDNETEPTSNCDFHVWAWNTFLWMTQMSGNSLRFESFATVADLFAPDAAPMRFSELPSEKILRLTVRTAKTEEMQDLDSVFQARTNGVIVHGPGETSGRAVYYSQNVEEVFFEFVRTNRYYDADVYEAAPPNTNFPVGAMEFKYSWKIVDENEDVSEFYTTPAEIFVLTEKMIDGKKTIVLDPDNTAKVTVALVGVHVVGVVKDHPEFIWATFEHVNNAPDLPPGMNITSPDPVSNRDWTFYDANTPAKDSNRNPNDDLRLVNAQKQLLSPTVDVFRAFAFGGGSPENVANIQSLNASVKAQVTAGTVWENYMLVGGVWTTPNNLIPGSFVSPQLGSTSLANATMETFDQIFAGVNCLACHAPAKETKDGITVPALNMNISHIMKNGFFSQRKSGN
ncbi:hypothetical protein [Mesorhizobium sp. KR9-304]|uniref:hypothetical protein n=1 Tax=Mesorhizobium sp. KR9-304 TaxID=3156614 RepID=UPI0032B621BB